MSYAPDIDPLQRLEARDTGVISTYALGRDYHDVIKGKLKHLAQWLAGETLGMAERLMGTIRELSAGMDMRFLYDPKRKLGTPKRNRIALVKWGASTNRLLTHRC